MENHMQMYAMRLAEEARKTCEDKNIIDREKLILELKDIKNILNFFRCKLQKNKINRYSISKIKEEKYDFIIYYTSDKFCNSSNQINKIKILTGLGEMFLAEEQINNEINEIGDSKLGSYAIHSETFARAFLMPEKLFIKEATNQCFNGKINLTYVAKFFDLHSFDTMARGYELKLLDRK